MPSKITASDVARLAGTSVASVSRAFRNDRPISEETRARVMKAANELGYMTPSGQGIAAMTTGTITLVAGDLENPFYPYVANILSQEILSRKRRMILHPVPPEGHVDMVMRQVLDYKSDAVILTSTMMGSQLARECRRQNIPVILFNRLQPDAQMTAVVCDNYGGGRMVAQRMIDAGRKRIALIGGPRDTSTHLERVSGFQDTMEAAGQRIIAQPNGGFTYAGALAAAKDLFAQPFVPDAVFCLNDVMGLATIEAARAAGLGIPDDVAIIGFDDIPMADWASFRLTTVRQPVRQMAADALSLIEQQLIDRNSQGSIRIAPVRMIARDSG